MEAVKEKIQLPKYPAYKDSGVEWVGKIPDHWSVKKLKHIFIEKKNKTNPNLNCGSISYGRVIYKDDEKVPEATKNSYQEVLKGDFLINPLNLNYDLISLRIALSEINVVVSSGYIVLKNRIELDKSYFNYLLHIFDVSFMKTLGAGVRQTLSYTHLANSELIYPPKEEQKTIAKFLHEKCWKIDTAITQKQQLIALLKERQEIIIQNAVTKGLDPHVNMKDSGVEWIGEIPQHWEVDKFKHIFYEKRKTFNSTLKCGSISFGEVVYKPDEKIPESTKASYQEVLKGEFLINPLNLNYDLVSLRIALSEIDVVVSSGYIVIKSKNEMVQNFYKFLLHRYDVAYMKLLGSGVRQTISFNHLANSLLIIPPKNEQLLISNYIEVQSSQIFQAITLQQQQIEKLKEYKSSLIDAAVTGKIKVN